MGRWGGRDCDYAGARDEWSEEAREAAAKARKSGGGSKAPDRPFKSGGFNKAWREEKAKKEAAESKEPYNIMNYVGRQAKDSGRWGGRASDTAGARDAEPKHYNIGGLKIEKVNPPATKNLKFYSQRQLQEMNTPEAKTELDRRATGARDGMATDPG